MSAYRLLTACRSYVAMFVRLQVAEAKRLECQIDDHAHSGPGRPLAETYALLRRSRVYVEAAALSGSEAASRLLARIDALVLAQLAANCMGEGARS